MSPRQTSSVSSGARGAITRVSVSSAVYSVSKASASSAQKRSRWVRTYQLVRTSRCSRTDSHAPEMSYASSCAVTVATRSCVRASRYRSRAGRPGTRSAVTGFAV